MLDVLNYVVRFVQSNKDKFRLMLCNTKIMNGDHYFNELININKIKNSNLFNKFTSVTTNNFVELPSSITHLTLSQKMARIQCMQRKYTLDEYIPPTVTHLYCNDFKALYILSGDTIATLLV